jgi:hypothetical protein
LRSAFRSTPAARRPACSAGLQSHPPDLATGTDAIAERQDWNKIRYADDTLMLCVQGATHWDALSRVPARTKPTTAMTPS